MNLLKNIFLPAIRLLIIMTLLTGLIYPGVVTILARVLYHNESAGSLIVRGDQIIGSALIGQNFDSRKYFHSRPSATNYNTLPSGGSNLGPLNPSLLEKVSINKTLFMESDTTGNNSVVPAEMITASASGLDPHISPETALMQVNRIVDERGLDENGRKEVISLINKLTEERQFYVLGEPRINVFVLNLKLDSIK